MGNIEVSQILTILATLLGCAFYSGVEIAFLTSNKLKIELDKKQGIFGASILSSLVGKPKIFLAMLWLVIIFHWLYMELFSVIFLPPLFNPISLFCTKQLEPMVC